MKYALYILILLSPCLAAAQAKVVKYFDGSWAPAEQQKSIYTGEFIKENDKYKCVFYWTGSTTIAGKATYADTTLNKPIGTVIGYHKNGRLEDSAYYDNNSNLIETFHFYKTGKLEVHYKTTGSSSEPDIEAFDESGKKIKNYLYAKEAEFKGGEKAWRNYIAKNVNAELKAEGKEEKTVTVKVLFAVSEFGTTANVKIVESSGIRQVDNDAMRVIRASPVWNNAVYLNKPVQAYRIQPFTYILSPNKN